MKKNNIKFMDLRKQQRILRSGLQASIQRVLDHGQYIMGPEVQALEIELAEYIGCKYCKTCANGTDALLLALKATGVGADDLVIVPSMSFAATAEAVVNAGATPIFVDIELGHYSLSAEKTRQAIVEYCSKGLCPKAVICVDLYGIPSDYDSLKSLCKEYDIALIADGAQSFGAMQNGKCIGNIADITTTSFFPAKPLGCYGDGGAIFTNNEKYALLVESLRVHGKGDSKYDNVRVGFNSRLDTIQAAILLEKLKIYRKEQLLRNEVSNYYSEFLNHEALVLPKIRESDESAWALYTIRVLGSYRDKLESDLRQARVPTQVYYRKPLHLQAAFSENSLTHNALATTELYSTQVLSLPMHSFLKRSEVEFISNMVIKSVEACVHSA